MEHVIRQARLLKRACGKRDAEWGEQSNAITELADAVEVLAVEDHYEAINEHLVPLAAELEELLRNIRSKLVSDVCEQLGRIVKTTRLAFTPLANAMLQGLCDTAKASSVAIRNPGFRLFSDVSEYSRYDLDIVHKVYRSSPQERVRVLLLEQLHIAFTYWPKHEIESSYNELLDVMRRGMRDPSSHVRSACRQSFCSFTDLWSERVEELVDVPTVPARELLIKEKPHATISKAMQQKFGSTPSKAARTDSMNAIRQQRAALKRQGTASGDDAFIEVTESARRPMQRPTTDAPNRAVSPGRSVPRAASPSATTRGSTRVSYGQRASSPSSVGRSASPGATARSASPVFGASRAITVSATHVRGASPSRATQAPPSRLIDREQAPKGLQSTARLGEFDRYLSLTGQEEKPVFALQEPSEVAPTIPPREKLQKRVSIAEPPTVDPTRTLSFDSVLSSTSNIPAPISQPPWAVKPANQANRGFDSKHAMPSLATASQPSQQLSFGRNPGPATSFAAAAQSFISQSQSGQWHRAEPPTAQPTNRSLVELRALDSAKPSESRDTLTPRHQKRDGEHVGIPETPLKPDTFLDRPIPSSAPAPEPRASSNVTTRGRRPSPQIMGPLSDVDNPLPHPVPTVPVPEMLPPSCEVPPKIQRPRFLDETFPPPPAASLDSAFLQSNMASENHYEHPFPVDEENENKENLHAGQENRSRAPNQVSGSSMDAISVLGALRGNMRATKEKLESTKVVEAPQVLTQANQNGVIGLSNGQSKEQQQEQPPSLKGSNNQGRDQRNAIPSTTGREDLRQGISATVQQKQESTPVSQAGGETKVADPAKASFKESSKQVSTSEINALKKPVSPIANVSTNGSHPEPTDFIRTPAPFKFAPPQPRQQPPRPPTSAPQMHVSGSRAQTNRPASESNAFKREGHGVHRDHLVRANADPGLRQRQPRNEEPLANVSSKSAAANSSTLRQLDGGPSLTRRHTVLNPQPQRLPANVAVKMLYSFCLVLVAIFGLSGLIEAATKVRNAYEYHQSLLDRINQFETSIVESYESVRKMNDKYAVWSEYVRELTDQDESNALNQLESIQLEVEKWQREMKSDLLEFKKSLSGDIIDAALAPLRDSNGSDDSTPTPARP